MFCVEIVVPDLGTNLPPSGTQSWLQLHVTAVIVTSVTSKCCSGVAVTVAAGVLGVP